jgi:hypothetical protein
MGRFRQLLVFDRFLARIFEHFGERAIAKGGVVLELRLERARTTRDVDVRLTGPSDTLLVELQRARRLDLGDFLTFLVEPDHAHPTIDNDGMVYQGLRFRVQGQLAAQVGPLDGAAVREALDATFAFRRTHPLPSEVPTPPASWTPVYARMVEEDDLPWRTLPELLGAVRSFLDPVLAGQLGTWNQDTWSW